MKKIPVWLYIVIGLAIMLAIKFLLFPKKSNASVPGKGKNSAPVGAGYYIAKKTDPGHKIYTTGKTGALNSIEIRSEVTGKVSAIHFKEGDQIQKGTSLLRINDAELQAQLQKNRIQLKLSEEKLNRLKKLLDIKGISQEEYDIQYNELESLKADLAYLQAQLAKTNITAPFTGVIGLRNISEGAYVGPTQVIATLVQLQPLFIEFSVPEKYSSAIKKGQIITFTSGESGAATYSAGIYALEPVIDEATRTLRGRALYTGKDQFYPGSFVKVFIDPGKSEPSIFIPSQSLIPVLKGQKVFISNNGIAEEREVISGIRTEDMVQILQGINEGDTVLTTGLMSVRPQSKLKLIKAKN